VLAEIRSSSHLNVVPFAMPKAILLRERPDIEETDSANILAKFFFLYNSLTNLPYIIYYSGFYGDRTRHTEQ
jgi:hypothetical protein